jgi:murein DD-endopeptidase MepM/ murein hydrolase activator NlpD
VAVSFNSVIGGLGYNWVISNSDPFGIWLHVIFPYAGATPKSSGTFPLQYDATANKYYVWVYADPGTANAVAFTTNVALGSGDGMLKDNDVTSCQQTTGVLRDSFTNDLCYRINYSKTDPTFANIQFSTTYYSPLSIQATLFGENAALEGSGASTINGRQPGGSVTFETAFVAKPIAGGSAFWYIDGLSFNILYGSKTAVHSSVALYWYPFSGNFQVVAGNGSPTHAPDGPDHYALDFDMPEGTPIYAARAGYVSFVREGNSKSRYDSAACPDPETCVNADDNAIVITHADKTQSYYLHLQQVRTFLSASFYAHVANFMIGEHNIRMESQLLKVIKLHWVS